MAIFELREYQVFPGKMDDWVKLMEEEIMPFQIGQGMVINGSFRSADDSTYIWIRRFEDDGHLKALYAKVYESDHWKNEIAPRIGGLIDREKHVIRQIVPTSASPIQ